MGTTLKFLSENTVRKCTFGKPAEEIAKGGDDDGSEEAGEGYYGITAEAEDVQG